MQIEILANKLAVFDVELFLTLYYLIFTGKSQNPVPVTLGQSLLG